MAIRVERLSGHTKLLIQLLIGLLLPVCAWAQQPIVPLQLSLSDPGARSMAFGGAFVALADDATAAFANPAGLTQLLRPEISVEWRRRDFSIPYAKTGRVEGLPSGYGLDTTVDVKSANSNETTSGLAFLSFAYPTGNWSFALYRHEYADLKFSGETQGLFSGGTDCCQTRLYDQRSTSELDILSHGFSTAYRVNDKLDLGLGVVYFDTTLESNVTQFTVDDDSLESIFGPNSYLPERSLLSQRSFSDDSDWTVTMGILWRPSERWSIGGVYRQGLETGFAVELRAGEAVDYGVPPGEIIAEGSLASIEFPDIFGLGVAYRDPGGRLTVSFQWNRVEYSDIPHSIDIDDQTIDDANELHLGAEYVFLESTPIIALRLGTWLEPDHQMRAIIDDPILRAMLPRGEDEVHFTAGLGLAMQNFQIDLAVDFADRQDTLSISAIYNF